MTHLLRILYATAETHPTYRPDVGVLFGEGLPANGVAVDLLAVADDVSTAPRWPGGRAILRRGGSRLGTQIADVVQQLTLFRRVQAYDAVVVRDKPVLGVLGWLACRRAGVPYCYWMSYPLPEQCLWLASHSDGRIGSLRRWWLRLRGLAGQWCLAHVLVPRSDWLFVQSAAMEASLRTGPLDHDRVTPVPMGVDSIGVPPPAAVLPPPLGGRRLAVYLGTLDRSRHPELLVDAAREVAARIPDFTMVVIGEADEPADRGWLQRYAESVGAGDAVHFTGRLPTREALALVGRAEVGVSPVPRNHLTEVGSPTKVVEYLACGVPAVCNDQPDQAWVVQQSGGGWVCDFTAPAFASAIVAALADPAAARARAHAGREWVARHRSYRELSRLVAARIAAVAGREHVLASSAAEVKP
jgi:glycosyltransferase involved in cell wall biosynthesis